jgi:hypothetical protein
LGDDVGGAIFVESDFTRQLQLLFIFIAPAVFT